MNGSVGQADASVDTAIDTALIGARVARIQGRAEAMAAALSRGTSAIYGARADVQRDVAAVQGALNDLLAALTDEAMRIEGHAIARAEIAFSDLVRSTERLFIAYRQRSEARLSNDLAQAEAAGVAAGSAPTTEPGDADGCRA